MEIERQYYFSHGGLNLLELLARHVVEVGPDNFGPIASMQLFDGDGLKRNVLS